MQGLRLRHDGTDDRQRRRDNGRNGVDPDSHGGERGTEAGEAVDQPARKGAKNNDNDLLSSQDAHPPGSIRT
jgi:hypothetical protein